MPNTLVRDFFSQVLTSMFLKIELKFPPHHLQMQIKL
jgi:hypothetical protein